MRKGFAQILIVVAIVVAIGVVGFVAYSKNKVSYDTPEVAAPVPSPLQEAYNEGANGAPSINSRAELDAASRSLDATNTTQIDSELNALGSDSSGF